MTTELLEESLRKRLSTLWKVEPYRVHVKIEPKFSMTVDGAPPTKRQMTTLENDIRASAVRAKLKMC